MAVIYVDVEQRSKYIMLGEQGEKNAVVVKFDISTWLSAFGSGGSAFVDVMRPGDATAYTKQIELEGSYAVWAVDDIDNAVAGKGKVQLTYLMLGDDGRSKTATFVTMVDKSLDASGDVPDPYESYLEEAREIRAETTQNAETAQAAAQAASTKAGEASTSASEAYTSARSAKRSEENAERSASTASEAAEEILGMTATATTLPEGSEATVEYNDGVMAFGIPKGDTGARGARGDTGETGATPQMSIGTVETLAPDEDATATITGTAEAPVLNLGLPKGETGDVSKADLASLMPLETVSGSVASFSDGSHVFDAESALVTLEPIQSGSGTPSPDNVRPISGHDSASVVVAGRNLWDEEWESGAINGANGGVYTDSTKIRSKNYISVLPNTNYYIKMPYTFNYAWYDAEKRFIGGDNSATPNYTRSSPNNARYLKFSTVGTTYNHDISINYPSTDTDYHPSQGVETYTTTFPETVYGGTVDLVSGVLTVDRAMVDLGTLNWQTTSTATADGSQCHYATVSGMATDTANADMISDRFTLASGKYISQMVEGTMISGGGYIYVATDAATISGQLVYPLATPITYQLTPQAIALLTGDNNVWSDGGQIQVKYRANIGLYVDKKLDDLSWNFSTLIAPTEATYKAKRNYTTGQLLIVSNILYKVTANIANGGNIVPNTNVTATTLSDVIASS